MAAAFSCKDRKRHSFIRTKSTQKPEDDGHHPAAIPMVAASNNMSDAQFAHCIVTTALGLPESHDKE
jgi:hypothetical protein